MELNAIPSFTPIAIYSATFYTFPILRQLQYKPVTHRDIDAIKKSIFFTKNNLKNELR